MSCICIHMLSYIKKTKSFKSPGSILNPLMSTRETCLQIIKETLAVHDSHFADLSAWECPICYETVKANEMFISFPFDCNHITCFKCFRDTCDHIHLRSQGSVTKIIKCSLCRASPTQFWDKAKCVQYLPGTVYKRPFHLVMPGTPV